MSRAMVWCGGGERRKTENFHKKQHYNFAAAQKLYHQRTSKTNSSSFAIMNIAPWQWLSLSEIEREWNVFKIHVQIKFSLFWMSGKKDRKAQKKTNRSKGWPRLSSCSVTWNQIHIHSRNIWKLKFQSNPIYSNVDHISTPTRQHGG